jgi:predicted ATPase
MSERGDVTSQGNRNVSIGEGADNTHISTGDILNLFAKGAPATNPYELRSPLNDFVGREKEIEELVNALRSGGRAGICGINGLGGIGKTELAVVVANRIKDDYKDAQLFISMRGTDENRLTPSEALEACIRAFVDADAKLPDRFEELQRLYLRLLSNRRVLIVLDNASDADQVRPLMPPAGCALLITSRQSITLPGIDKRIRLEQLKPDKARKLFLSIAKKVKAKTANRICELCGYLPLAIRAAASLIDVAEDIDADKFAEDLSDEKTRLEKIGTEGIDDDVYACFNLSYKRLEEDAKRVFRRLYIFPATFDASAVEVICEDEGHKQLSDLLRLNFAIYDKDKKRYRLHDLVRIFANKQLSDDEREEIGLRYAEYYKDVLASADALYLKGNESIMRGLALFDSEWANIKAGQLWAVARSEHNEVAAQLCIDYADAGGILLLRQHAREQIFWLENALTSAREIGDRRGEGNALGNLGNAYHDLGETRKAIEFYEQHLAIAREIGDRRGENTALWNKALALNELGDREQAIICAEESLRIHKEIEDPFASKVRTTLAKWRGEQEPGEG